MSEVSATEELTRFILSRSLFSKQNARVKFGAFIPPKNRSEISVFCISGISEEEIWKLGEPIESGRKPILARADLQALEVFNLSLSIARDDYPFRHANIILPETEESKIKLLALELANRARLHCKT